MMSKYGHLRFKIAIWLSLIIMETDNMLYPPTSGAMSQRYGTLRLGRTYHYGKYSLSSHGDMVGASCLLWGFTNNPPSQRTLFVFPTQYSICKVPLRKYQKRFLENFPAQNFALFLYTHYFELKTKNHHCAPNRF